MSRMADAPAPTLTRRTVEGDGLPIAVWETQRTGTTVVLVHGYPDTHVVWNRVVERLGSAFHCVVYDVRGAGDSGVPADRSGYRLEHLRSDLVAVLDAVSPSAPVHLVGHDWGSLQAWDAVVRADSAPGLAGRIATYTTISGPCLDHVSAWTRAAWRGGWTRKREALRQLRHSWYVFAFQVPTLPEIVLRRLNRRLLATRQGGSYHFAATLPDDATRGINLYRANILTNRQRVPGGPYTDLPVQLVVPLRDRYVTPAFYRDLHRFVPDLTRVDLDAGHWAPYTHADEVARLIAEFAAAHPTR
jgi:pimeloyl-ACP methyl ester carboxylesterase